MENARLITETREALEQQTATAEVLQVINSSPGDLAPVFDAMLEKATRLCDAAFGIMRSVDGEQLRTVAYARLCQLRYAEFLARTSRCSARHGGIAARIATASRSSISVDLTDDESYRRDDVPTRRAMVDLGGARTSLSVRAEQGSGRCSAQSTSYRQEVAAVLRQADRAVAEFRGAGGHRDGERAADHRDARGAGAADRDRRGVAGHQFLARRSRAGVRCDP